MARLASGAKRFALPAEFNFIRLLRGISDAPRGTYGAVALERLAQASDVSPDRRAS